MSPPIGVLFPVRLETLAEQVNGRWRLLLRVIPDEVQIDRHDPRATDAELDAVEALWAAGATAFDDEFTALASRFGGARAAWLVRTFPTGFDRSTAPIRVPGGTGPASLPGFSAVTAFPSHYQVWAVVGGTPRLVHDQAVQVDQLVLDPTAPVEDRWWTSWAKAVEVGLGAEIDLDQIDPTTAIESLIVVGLDESVDPAPLFAAQRDAGRLAVLPVGAPTNTVAGAPTVDLVGSIADWLAITDQRPEAGVGGQLGEALARSASSIGPFLGGANLEPPDGSLVAALWPALWGFAGHDVWGWGSAVHEAGKWAGDNLRPLGPLPAIRIGDQPYGVLPTTSLGRWRAAAGDPAIEARLLAPLQALRRRSGDAATARGTTADADAAGWLELMADVPWTDRFGARWLFPLGLAQQMVPRPDKLAAWWRDTARDVVDLVGVPARPYLSISETVPIEIPLVSPVVWNPREDPNLVTKMIEVVAATGKARQWNRLLLPMELFAPFRPHGLDQRFDTPDSLLVRLAVRSLLVAAGHVAIGTTPATLLDPVVVDPVNSLLPHTVLEQLVNTGPVPTAGDPASRVLLAAIEGMLSLSGVDPANLEVALRAVLDTASHRIDPWITAIAWRRLQDLRRADAQRAAGIYGWVDGPLVGQPGPTTGGVLLATSDGQARTMAVLRDKAIHDPEGRWNFDLDSAITNAAVRLAEEIRAGAHPGEAVGRRVERILADRNRIDEARKHFPLRPGDQQRRVCDGLAMLAPGADLGFLNQEERDQILALQSVLDAYADLLLADGVHHVVQGRHDAARRSMDAAAGLALPPNLDVVRSPRPGRSAATSVLVVLPDRGAGIDPVRPCVLADAAVADYLERVLPAANDPAWTWTVTTPGGDVAVALADLGLAPADAVALNSAALDDAVLEQGGGSTLANRAPALDLAGRTLDVLRSQPWVDRLEIALKDPLGELLDRYRAAREAAKALVASASPPGANPIALLVTLRPWGVVSPALIGETPAARLDRAAVALTARLRGTPPEPTASDPPGKPEPSRAALLDAGSIARAIVALICPGTLWPVLARRLAASVTALEAPVGAEIDDWLGNVAPVRPRVAAVDAYQLDGAPFVVRLDRPGDVWQRIAGGADPSTRLTVAFGPAAAFAGGQATVAVGLVDEFNETVPASRSGADPASPGGRVLTATVGFNAPAARAPQAVLLAIPPDLDQPLDGPTLVDIVIETRELARARMARPADLESLAAGLPVAQLPMARHTGVDLTIQVES